MLQGWLGGISVEIAHRISMFLPDEGLAIGDPVDTNAAFKNPCLSPHSLSSRTKALLTWERFGLREKVQTWG